MGRTRAAATAVLIAVVVSAAAGCGADDDSTAPPTSGWTAAPGAATPPADFPLGGVVEYQIGGVDEPADDTAIVIRDREEAPAAGRYSICYVNAFQTQPGERELWTRDHPSAVLTDDVGEPVIDPGWPDELILDTSTEATRDEILAVVGPWIDRCAADGFQAVELDNLDSWTRAGVGDRLDEDDNVAMATAYVARAHAAGLDVGQKNTPQLGERARTVIGFDFAIAEECAFYEECGAYRDVYDAAVIDIEYTDNGRAAFERSCAADGGEISVVYRDRGVTPRADPGHVSEHC